VSVSKKVFEMVLRIMSSVKVRQYNLMPKTKV